MSGLESTAVGSASAAPARERMSGPAALATVLLLMICIAGICDWLSAKTQRLYVDDDSDAASQLGTVWQHFAIRGHNVVHQIITRDDARFVVPLNLRAPHKLRFKVKAKGASWYQIHWIHDEKRQLLLEEKHAKSGGHEISIPRGAGKLEFTEHGSIAWLDLRIVRSIFLWPLYAAAVIALAALTIQQIRAGTAAVAEWTTLVLVLLVTLWLMETLLQKNKLRLPAVVIAARGGLGLIKQDGRWVDRTRYKLRLRANLDTYAEWRVGDIARLGFIPQNVSRPVLHRFPIRTDAEGFRNAAVRERIDVAVLGDSFTDGTNSATEETWPSRLEQITGRTVQNYGTAGFGPQQERYVFQDFAARKKPRWTVLAFFAGNDLHDAEVFDEWERGKKRTGDEPSAAKLAHTYRRYETLYLWTVVRVAAESVRSYWRGGEEANNPALSANSDVASFDRGIFSVPTNGRLLQFAFFPPYLQKLGTTRLTIEASRGWELTRNVLVQLKSECEQNGSTLVIMFIPAKEQVYWPLAERSFSDAQLQEAIDFCCRYNHMALRVDEVRAQQSALNDVVRDFCASEQIPMLDLTPVLQARVAAGDEVYFPDDTHWNAAGHDVAARELAKFLKLTP